MSRKIYSVSEISSIVKDIFQDKFGGKILWVSGEISGFKGHYASGHWYFSLKDGKSQVSAVSFSRDNQRIKFEPENGMEVICSGFLRVYEKTGVYQLYVNGMEPRGVGADALALEELRKRLAQEGLFDGSKKRPLPFLSRKIGVVTSPSGAAVRDFIKVVYRRSPHVETVISPASVQGENAPVEIVKALERLYSISGLDIVVVTRGGGSREDLMAFNDERVARKIADSPYPVISAVGHEEDISVADLVADVRAGTPSMAAELAIKEKKEIVYDLTQLKQRLYSSAANRVDMFSLQLDGLASSFKYHMNSRIDGIERRIENCSGKLASLDPRNVLKRGYAIVSKQKSGEVVRESAALREKEKLILTLSEGRAFCTVDSTEGSPQES